MSDIYQQYEDFKKFEIIFRDFNDEPHKIKGKVHSITSSSITVYSSIDKQKAVDIPVGTEVKVYVYTTNGIYYADSKILSTVKDEKFIVYMLTYPVNNKHSQRREFFRADMSVPLTVTVVKNVLNSQTDTFQVNSRDICGNGISFVTEFEIKDYEEIFISIQFPEKVVETAARLVYTKTKETEGIKLYTYALTFIGIANRDIDFIVKKCFLHQLKLKNME
ncbi:flagellar brake domain-containing protein [bacterium]|nr:flagellar brake domain-containing protein [bacterium]